MCAQVAATSWSAVLLRRFRSAPGSHPIQKSLGSLSATGCVQNLFARQSRFHLIKLPKTIALHAYATII
jgi:hypothetical protein